MSRNDDRDLRSEGELVSPETPISRSQLEEKLRTWFSDLEPKAILRFGDMYEELLRTNKLINLVPNHTLKNAASIHFADAILAGRTVLDSIDVSFPLYDIGSGSGFPGLILAVLKPKQKIVLVERDVRKVEYLNHVISRLGLENIMVEAKDVEFLEPNSVRFAIARGFQPFSKSLLTLRKLVMPGGRFFHMKSDSWANEMSKVPSQLFSYWTPSLVSQHRLPDTSTSVAIVVTDKIAD